MHKTMLAAAFLLFLGTANASQGGKHAEAHNILSSDLPAPLQSDIKTAYSGYWITDLQEQGKDKHVKYALTLENADQVLHLRAGKGGDWEVVATDLKD